MGKTKIFISSVSEDGLKPLRRTAFRELESLGHEPLMWEENLGPWPSYLNPVEKCLEAVEESDLYVLFIGTKAGTYDPVSGITVTHSELISALDKGIAALVWADVQVKARFFASVAYRLDAYIDRSVEETGQYPDNGRLLDFLRTCEEADAHVDPYVWLLLYDLRQRGIYVEDLAAAVPIDWKSYFSDLLRRGLLLLPLEPSIMDNSLRLEQAGQSFDLMTALLPQVRLEPPGSWADWLATVSQRLQGRQVKHAYGSWSRETVGHYEACNGASLYRHEGGELCFVACCGQTSAVRAFALDDQSSYVALTYGMGSRAEGVYYKEARQKFFYCVRSGPYVATFHFPAGPSWSNLRYMRYKDSVNNAIIGPNTQMIRLVSLFLGGMRQ
ncbi:DUF4062 domain-containing protein [Paenibacillus humicus]|uniref:DUF4062 domain-containing protein n=1 Tax=Paenibacillus humicus TaxID=412861 RepID=UPI003F17281A